MTPIEVSDRQELIEKLVDGDVDKRLRAAEPLFAVNLMVNKELMRSIQLLQDNNLSSKEDLPNIPEEDINTFFMVRMVIMKKVRPPKVYERFNGQEWILFAQTVGKEAVLCGVNPTLVAKAMEAFMSFYETSKELRLAARCFDYEEGV